MYNKDHYKKLLERLRKKNICTEYIEEVAKKNGIELKKRFEVGTKVKIKEHFHFID